MRSRKAVFLDRDGVLNELVYFAEQGRIDTPLTTGQFRLVPGVVDGIKTLQASGYRVIIISNQPGIAKRQFTAQMFDRIRKKTRRLLRREGIRLDGEYYCLHHPHARNQKYREACDCRKPRPGLILKAAQEGAIDINCSFMVGDGFADIEAGRRAGCKTILVGHLSSLLTSMMESKQLYPSYLAETFEEAVQWIVTGSKRKERQAHLTYLRRA
jgi:D-glycero-D-manno-heptose 1,7-bisphosphate phosphatase